MRIFRQRTPDFEVEAREALNAAFGKKSGHTAVTSSGAVTLVDVAGNPIEPAPTPAAKENVVTVYPTDDPEITAVRLQDADALLDDTDNS